MRVMATTATTRTERIQAPDGGTFDGHLALPASGRGPGILVIQEIFGVNEYIQNRCAKLADLGYVALAPDAFWRIERNLALGPDDLSTAMGYAGRYDGKQGLQDLSAALAHLRALPETTGKVGVLGFCFGGTMAYLLACHADPDAVVSYYGSRIGSMLDQSVSIRCPLLFQYGARDPYISAEEIAKVGELAARPDVEHRVYDAGHAFDNEFSPMFSEPVARVAAWEVTTEFLAKHLQ
jgi:carboxymethylenebutenolidase